MPTARPRVEATFEWHAAPLKFTADPETRTLRVSPDLGEHPAALDRHAGLVMPEHVMTGEQGLDLPKTQAWILGRMPEFREYSPALRFAKYEHPLLVRHRATVTLPDGAVVHPEVRRSWGEHQDTFVMVLPTGEDPEHLYEVRTFRRPEARTGKELLEGFRAAADYVPDLIVRQGMNMDYPAPGTIRPGLPRGSRLIPAHELTARQRIVGIYRYTTGTLEALPAPLPITSSVALTTEIAAPGHPTGPYQLLAVGCVNSRCGEGHHHLKLPRRCAVAVLDGGQGAS